MKYYKVFASWSWNISIIDVYGNLIDAMFNNCDSSGQRCIRGINLLDELPADVVLSEPHYGSYAWVGIENDFNTIRFLVSGETYYTPDLCCIVKGGELGYVKHAEICWNTQSYDYEVQTEFSSGEVITAPLRYSRLSG